MESDALTRLQEWLGLHQRIDILYVVDGYEVSVSNDDGCTFKTVSATSLPAAILAALDAAGAP